MVTDKTIGDVWPIARGKMRSMGLNTSDQKAVIAALFWCAVTEDLATGGPELYGLQLMQEALDNEDKRKPTDWLLAAFAKHEARGIDMNDVKAVCRENWSIERGQINEKVSQLIRGER
jgi:hypothetical protein